MYATPFSNECSSYLRVEKMNPSVSFLFSSSSSPTSTEPPSITVLLLTNFYSVPVNMHSLTFNCSIIHSFVLGTFHH